MNLRSPVRRALIFAGCVCLAAGAPALAVAGAGERLSFDVTEGFNLNSFLREGPVAAHLLLRSGSEPRILVAFPAGNSGVGLWFAKTATPLSWALQGAPIPASDTDHLGRRLYGVSAQVTATGPGLEPQQAVLSSIRILRDYQSLGTVPAELAAPPRIEGRHFVWARDRLDGAAGYRLSIEVTAGDVSAGHILPAADGKIGLSITALTGETPLTPLSGTELLASGAAADPSARNALTYLSYREKFLAGSWRFDTYFGRDTLMSVRLLMPVLTPLAVESGLGAVLRRVSPGGEVAHEEDIGEFAILDHLRAGEGKSDRPVFDYKMIDGNYLLAPVLVSWLLDDPRGRSGAAPFLAAPDGRYGEPGVTNGADLVKNLRLVLQSAAAFADDPRVTHLIGLHPGQSVGQWRDSGDGLGGGRFPYDVNAVFVPAALGATARLFGSGLLDPYLTPADRTVFARAATMARVWAAKAAPWFEVEVSNAAARTQIESYARTLGIAAAAAQDSIGTAAVRFHAVSLEADGRPVPILNSDEGFALLFGRPGAQTLDRALAAVMRPFPAGLLTDVGLVVANPVHAATDLQQRFNKNAYHGAVIWSWQQAVFAAGLERQLRRKDLPPATMARLRGAQAQAWRAIDAGRVVRNSELWSWTYQDGRFLVAPFGASNADADESNAAQLWSTVFLAIPKPAP
jgi:hypothetical protein